MSKEPAEAELDAIEAEWPVIAAELELVDAECWLARVPADVLARRAHRRAVRGLLAVLADVPEVSPALELDPNSASRPGRPGAA